METFWNKEFGNSERKLSREDLADVGLNAENADDNKMKEIAELIDAEMKDANEMLKDGTIRVDTWSELWWGSAERCARFYGLKDI